MAGALNPEIVGSEMSADTIQMLPVTDAAEVPILAHLSDIALKPDGFYEFLTRYGSQSVYDEVVGKLTQALEDPHSYIFKAVRKNAPGSDNPSDSIIGFAHWFIGYVQTPKVDPFALRVAAQENKDSSFNVAVPETHKTPQMSNVNSLVAEPTRTLNPLDEMMRISGNAYISAIRGKKHVCQSFLILSEVDQRPGQPI